MKYLPSLTKLALAALVGLISFKSVAQSPSFIPHIKTQKAGEVAPGYILLALFSMDSVTNYASGLMILDSAGVPVLFNPSTSLNDTPYSQKWVLDFKLQPDGSLSYFQGLTLQESMLYFLNHQLQLVDSQTCISGLRLDPHDAIREKDGTTHLLCFEHRSMDASGLTNTNGQKGSDVATVEGNVIHRLNNKGELVWSWKSLDHYALNDLDERYFTDPNHVDHTHFNSLAIDHDGHYLASSRNLNEVTKINSQTGKIIWRFGGKKNEFTLLNDSILFSGQHDARQLPNGHLSLFDNATQTPNGVARGVEYALDTVNMTATLVWKKEIGSGHKSMFIGSCQLLTKGHRLIDWGGVLPFSETISIQEVDSSGKEVLTMDLPDNFISYRAFKLPLPELDFPEITCVGKKLTAPKSTYYLWSTQDTSQSITFTDTGTYFVWTERNGIYQRSNPIYISDTAKGCGSAEIVSITRKSDIEVYPVPATRSLYVRYGKIPNYASLQILDLAGRQRSVPMVQIDRHTFHYNIESLESGIYLLKGNGLAKRFVVE